jgi:hypothetical protein
VQALGDAADLSNVAATAQAIQHNPDRIFRRRVGRRMFFTTCSAGFLETQTFLNRGQIEPVRRLAEWANDRWHETRAARSACDGILPI